MTIVTQSLNYTFEFNQKVYELLKTKTDCNLNFFIFEKLIYLNFLYDFININNKTF
jgi:hypothetical protein